MKRITVLAALGVALVTSDAVATTSSWGDLAVGKFYTYSTPPSSPYLDRWPNAFTAGARLTDELGGEEWPLDNWVGWYKKPVAITVDLGKAYSASQFVIRAASRTEWSIHYPKEVKIEASLDGASWIQVGKPVFPSSTEGHATHAASVSIWEKARFVRFSFPATAGWLFVDELWVRGTRVDTRKHVPEHGAYHGAYSVKQPCGAFPFCLDWKGFEAQVERSLKIVLWYSDWAMPYEKMASVAAGLGDRFLEVGWLPASTTTKQIAAGSHDVYLRQWFTDAAADGHVLFIRPMNEMNGSWTYPGNGTTLEWGGDPQSYRWAWRRMYNIAEKVGATGNNQVFVWSPDGNESGAAAYYPGPTYVDWVGVSAYATTGVPCQPAWKGSCLGNRLTDVEALVGGSKPLMIAEGGCRQGSAAAKLACVRDWFAVAEEHGLSALVYENHNANTLDSPALIDAYLDGFTSYILEE